MPDAAGLTLTIDLGALARNWAHLARIAGPAECAAVVKADAYGLGIEQAVPALRAAGCRTFFVALPGEGRRACAAAPDAVTYVLGGFFPEAAGLYAGADLRPVLNCAEDLEAWERLGAGRPAALHVDTGMNRLGFSVDEALALAGSGRLKQAGVALLVSHLACADEPDHPKNRHQLRQFEAVRAAFSDLPASFANSAGTLLGREYAFDLVRPGIALYGAACIPGRNLEVVVTAEARILQVRTAKAGETVGYGGTQTLRRDSRIAILAAGYADGYLRSAGSTDAHGGASVLIHGRRAPLVGRVSMDLMAADVTDISGEVRPGDRAEIFGPNISVDEVAAAAGTIPYEFLTGLSRRAERIYATAGDGA
jgi:alanine racemase